MTDLPNELIPDSAVDAALHYLAQDPHPVAVAKADVTRAENIRKSAHARAFLTASGKTIEEKKALAELDPQVEAAKKHEGDAIEKFEGERARVTWATTITELWRSVQANVRAAERVR